MPLKTQLDETPSVNLTPMIDIVFLLMIFFMVGTKCTIFNNLSTKMATMSKLSLGGKSVIKSVVTTSHQCSGMGISWSSPWGVRLSTFIC